MQFRSKQFSQFKRLIQCRDWLRLPTAGALTAWGVPAAQARLPYLVTVSGAITEVVYLLGGQEKLLDEPTGADASILAVALGITQPLIPS